MNKKVSLQTVLSRVLLIFLFCMICITNLFGQESKAEKIDFADYLVGNYISSNKSEAQANKLRNFYEKCNQEQKDAVRSYLIKTITDSLRADYKQKAIDYIDGYKVIANPNDEYLASLLLTQSIFYYDNLNQVGLSEIIAFMENVASQSSLDYTIELQKVKQMQYEVVHAGENLLGYWVVDFNEKAMYPPFYLNIYRDTSGEYHVDVLYDFHPDIKIYSEGIKRDTGLNGDGHFRFWENQNSLECIMTNANTLSYYWSSEKLKVGKEYLANSLRSGVRGMSSSIIGNLARSNEHSTSTMLLGSVGSIFGEVLLNSIIDEVSVSKKTIQTVTCYLSNKDKNTISATFYMDYFRLRTDNSNIEHDSISFNADLIRFDITNDYVRDNIAFLTNKPNGGLGLTLRQVEYFTRERKKDYYKRHPEAKELRHTMSLKKWTAYNREQIEKLKQYNMTH